MDDGDSALHFLSGEGGVAGPIVQSFIKKVTRVVPILLSLIKKAKSGDIVHSFITKVKGEISYP